MIKINPAVHYGSITKSQLVQNVKGSNIIVVCSNTVWNKSYIKKVINELKEDYRVKIYTHLQPNAPFSDLQKIIDENLEVKPDTIIAIGGGSVLDASKALSVSFAGLSINDLFYKNVDMPSESIHLVSIPTTAGTGAELSFGAIIYDDVNNVKGGIRGEVIQSNVVFIDAELYRTAPPKLLAEVGFDCLTHAMETYLSVKSDPLTRYQSVSAIKTVLEFLPQAVAGDMEALKRMSIASAMMGINLAYSSTCLPHRIQYVIGPLTNTSHAQGLIALYTGWLKLIGTDKSKSGLLDLEKDMNSREDIIERIYGLKEELDINYTISTLGVKENQLEFISQNVKGSVQNDPCYVDNNTILNVLKHSL